LRAQFFIISAVIASLALLTVTLSITIVRYNYNEEKIALQNLISLEKDVVKDSLGRYPAGYDVENRLGKLKNASTEYAEELGLNITIDYSNASFTFEFTNYLKNNIKIKNNFKYHPEVVMPVVKADGILKDWLGVGEYAVCSYNISQSASLDIYLSGGYYDSKARAFGFFIFLRNTSSPPYRVFIDSDLNSSTGYSAYGFDYMINYSGSGAELFKYTGSGSSWQWSSLGDIESYRSGETIEILLRDSLIGSPEKIRIAASSLGERCPAQGYITLE